ncbi:hypothetical protein M2317_002195 [Microbacterium sp. ZKA21]|uniref:hypothetical protein n=1 Tax=Microbacterium sp. ZKA21 TaxID=3381694 RepID=UPI003D25F057
MSTVDCRDCGRAVADPTETFPSATTGGERPTTLTLCPTCVEDIDHAEHLASRLHLDPVAVLAVIRAVGIVKPKDRRWTTDDPDLYASGSWHVHAALAAAGGDAGPYRLRLDGERRRTQDTSPWGWLPDRVVEKLTTALAKAEAEADHLAENPPTTRVAAPAPGGCSVCGVNGADAPTLDVYRGTAKPFTRRASMMLCPSCAQLPGDRDQIVRYSAVITAGITEDVARANEQATARGDRPPRLPRLTPWSRSGKPASDEPWGWFDIEGWAVEALAALTPARPRTPTLEELAERVARLEHRAGIGG